MNLFILFTVLNVINVILQTIKSIITVKCGKWLSATINAVAYGLYQVILVYAVCDLPLYQKVTVVALANFVGVFIVKFFEEKSAKDKLWKIECTIPTKNAELLDNQLKAIPHSYQIITSKHTVFNFYCSTKEQSKVVIRYAKTYGGKLFASESKIL